MFCNAQSLDLPSFFVVNDTEDRQYLNLAILSLPPDYPMSRNP